LLNGFAPPAEADHYMTGYNRCWAAVWKDGGLFVCSGGIFREVWRNYAFQTAPL
jgi:hypothetical protein